MWYNQNGKIIFAFPARQEQSMLEHKIRYVETIDELKKNNSRKPCERRLWISKRMVSST